MKPRLLAALLLLFLLAVALTPPASGEGAIIRFLRQEDALADMTRYRGFDMELDLEADVIIDVDYPATVTLSARASGWTCYAIPSEVKVLPGTTIISATAVFTVPANETDGLYTASLVATWETPQGTPIQKGNSTRIRVVQNRAGLGPIEENFSVEAGGAYGIGLPVKNRGSLEDEFNITAWVEDTKDILVGVEPKSVVVPGGETRYVQLQMEMPGNLPVGNRTLVVEISSVSDPQSTSRTEISWSSTASVAPVVIHDDATLAYLFSIGCVMAFGSAVFFLGFTEVGLFAIGVLLLPLYVRIKREKVLDNFLRGQIYGYIKGNPGCTYTEVMDNVGGGNGVTAYHLSVLVREDFVVTTKDGLHRRFFPLGHPDRKKKFFPSRIQKDIMLYLKEHPGASQTGIAKGLRESKQVVNYHISILSTNGVVAVDNRGRRSMCYLKAVPEEEGETVVQVVALGSEG